MWPDRRILDLFGIELPILQAPMAGAQAAELAIAVTGAGGLGAIPTATIDAGELRNQLGIFRQRQPGPVNVNFFCHVQPAPDPERAARWIKRLGGLYAEFGVDPASVQTGPGRKPFDEASCAVIEEFRPEVVSFHFGLPSKPLLERVRATGAKIISSATTVAEARFLAAAGCDAIIAQGAEAGGHRGMFLTPDIATQLGTFALVPQVVDAVRVPVIAAGGISDGRGMAAAFALGAAAVQVGTAFLRSPESAISRLHREALADAGAKETALTNLFTGRPARGFVNRFMRELGPMNAEAPEFPLATGPITPLRAAAEKGGSGEFSPLWSGQAAALAPELPAAELTRRLAADAESCLKTLVSR